MSEEVNISRISNLGNTCYQNGVLHPLIHTPGGFIEYILTGDYLNQFKKHKSTDEIKNSLLFQFHRILNSIFKNNDLTLNPHTWKKTCGEKNDVFEGFHQQDAQEFLSFILDNFIEDIGIEYPSIPRLAVDNKDWTKEKLVLNLLAEKTFQNFHRKKYSLLIPMFNGLCRSNISCTHCGYQSNHFSPFSILGLSIPVDATELNDCLEHYSKEEELDNENLIKCSGCYQKVKGKKTESIWKLPKYLIFHIKRFKHDMFGRITTKDNTLINYPLELDMKPFVDKKSKYKEMSSEYYLYGVTLHSGMMMNGFSAGHYTALVRNRTDKKWYYYNDEAVPKQVPTSHLVHQNAYLLFYCRKD